MKRIESYVKKLCGLLKSPELDNFEIMRNCRFIDKDIATLRYEPGIFDDTDLFNVFPMILMSYSEIRL